MVPGQRETSQGTETPNTVIARLASPRRILQQRDIYRASRQVNVSHDGAADKDIFDGALYAELVNMSGDDGELVDNEGKRDIKDEQKVGEEKRV